MSSLPTLSNNQYKVEVDNNTKKVEDLFRQFFPEFPQFVTPFDDLCNLLSYLEETNVNVQILPRVVRGVHNIMIGTGEGEVIVHVRKGVTTIETKEREYEIKTRNIYDKGLENH